MLRKIRITLSIVSITLTTLLFLGVVLNPFMAKIQFLPAVMAMDFVVLAVLLALTLLLGRVYCSVVCPLGIMQDFFSWIGGRFKKNRFSYSKEKRWLRYGILAVFVVMMIIGFAPVTTLLAPYSAYGRIVNSLFQPLYDLLNNAIAKFEANNYPESYRFTQVEIWMRSVTTLVVAILTLVILAFLAWWKGRLYCNTICPVGTFLGLFSRFSLLRVKFDEKKCKKCGMCEKNCKAEAIDFKNCTVDYSRCVVCGNCLDKCKFDALHYGIGKTVVQDKGQEVDEGRRAFLVGTALAGASAAVAQAKIKVDGGFAVIEDKVPPQRHTPITPPGSESATNVQRHCTACQLCVSNCPNDVLRPSTEMRNFMQPVMSFERGYCRPECTRCSEVCPTGAIKPRTAAEKSSIHVGYAVWIKENCVVLTDKVSCGNCARHCPTEAIQMVEYSTADGTCEIPTVDEMKCIGCGACENLCPARPFSAIYVEGNDMHRIQ